VTRYTHGANIVLLDSSPFFNFCQGGAVIYLMSYLAERAHITLEVNDELTRNAATYKDLQTLDRMRWPLESNRHELPAPLKQELLDILHGLQKPADHPLKHAGEISTVLMAQHLGGELIVLEDRDGKALAKQRQVPRMSSAMLAAEMTAANAIEEDVGYAVFDAATPTGVGRTEWERALAEARAAITPAAATGSATSATATPGQRSQGSTSSTRTTASSSAPKPATTSTKPKHP
jgi:hypothetical protein